MRTSKQKLLVLVGSPLLWIGMAGALVSFLTYYLLYSGRLQPIADLADALHLGIFVFPFLACILIVCICLVASGIIMGAVRLCRKLNEITAAKTPEHL
jgi:cell division protein FtsX